MAKAVGAYANIIGAKGINKTQMSAYSWFNAANGGQINPTSSTAQAGQYQFAYASWSNDIQLAMLFGVTASSYQISGYYFWWDGTNSTQLYDMCLWQFSGSTWSFVANSDVTSPSLVSGWNYLALGTPIALQSGALYAIMTDQTSGFFDNSGFYASFPDGLTNGPLILYGPNNIPDGQIPGVFSEQAGTSAAAMSFPATTYEENGYPIDVLIQTSGILTVSEASLPPATLSTAYSQTLTQTGGTGPYAWSIISGNLPNGLSLSGAGVISGTPTTAGNASFTVQVEDADSNTATAALSITTGYANAVITYRGGATATIDTATSCTITVPGSVAPGDVVLVNIQQVVVGSTAGTLSAASTGTQPVQLGNQQNALQTITPGTLNAAVFGFTAGPSDAGATITISAPDSGYWTLALAAYIGTQLPLDVVGGTANNTQAAITCPVLTTTQNNDLAVYLGGGASETVAVPTAPAGSTTRESLISSTSSVAAVIADSNIAMPTGANIGGGQFSTSAAVGGSGTPNLFSAFTIGLVPLGGATVSITTTAFANMPTGVPITRFVSASGGTAPYSWSVSSGSLPDGLTLAASGALAGTLSGAATTAGDYSFTLEVTDSASNTASSSLSITVVDAPLSPTSPTTDGNGVITWQVTSAINFGDSESIRVLEPTAPNPSYPHGFLFTLPVAGGTDDTSFGNGLDNIRELGLHNTYNLTVIEASSGGFWFADNPTNTSNIQESYMLQVAAWAQTTYGTGKEKLYLIGFSRSGIGGQGLFFRHPDIFHAVASWDFPAMMTTYDGTDVDGTTGGDPAGSYGTQDNFADNYELSTANLTRWSYGQDLTAVKRIWIGGYFAFYDDVNDYDPVLTSLGIQHTASLIQASEHNWAPTPGWVAPALATLLGPPAASLLIASLF